MRDFIADLFIILISKQKNVKMILVFDSRNHFIDCLTKIKKKLICDVNEMDYFFVICLICIFIPLNK
jgi:hypothetical protein